MQQMEVDPRHDVTFVNGLKTILRLDPDVIMIGEIRDPETASVAMRAASSGKYVLTTFHTRDIASTVTGLRDLCVDSRSLAGNLRGIIAQRLVRRLCPTCVHLRPLDDDERALFAEYEVTAPTDLGVAIGCPHCRHTGYRGRIGVFEVESNNRELADAIESGEPEEVIRDRLRAQKSVTLAQDALWKVAQGITSLDEAQRMSWVDIRVQPRDRSDS
jgi:type II secretory ATPase GspE/PulE/Tfp pilus assembly ATPase PilB-like protein